MPRADDRYQMKPHRHGWVLFIDPEKLAEATPWRDGRGLNSIARFDMSDGRVVDSSYAGEHSMPMEPQYENRERANITGEKLHRVRLPLSLHQTRRTWST
jgi:hypothetical protein